MKDIEENDIFIFYLPMVIVALLIQLSLAALILWPNKDILKCTVWSDEEYRSFRESTRNVTSVELMEMHPNHAAVTEPTDIARTEPIPPTFAPAGGRPYRTT